jgi:hypothetical protein
VGRPARRGRPALVLRDGSRRRLRARCRRGGARGRGGGGAHGAAARDGGGGDGAGRRQRRPRAAADEPLAARRLLAARHRALLRGRAPRAGSTTARAGECARTPTGSGCAPSA